MPNLPTYRQLRSQLGAIRRLLRDCPERDCDVRLAIHADGTWSVRHGLPDYDADGDSVASATIAIHGRADCGSAARSLLREAAGIE